MLEGREMIRNLAVKAPHISGNSGVGHDVLVGLHWIFLFAFPVGAVILFILIVRSDPVIKLWHLVVPLVIGWLAASQFSALDRASHDITHGAAAHLGSAKSDVSPGEFFILIGMIVLVVFMRRSGRGPEVEVKE
jgi:hypothetical protein